MFSKIINKNIEKAIQNIGFIDKWGYLVFCTLIMIVMIIMSSIIIKLHKTKPLVKILAKLSILTRILILYAINVKMDWY